MQDVTDMSCTVKLELSFLKIYSKILLAYDSFRLILGFLTYLYFQGCHNSANFETYKLMATLKIKSDPIFLLGMFKNL